MQMLSFTRQCREIIQVKQKTFTLLLVCMANLLRTIHTKFYLNPLGFVKDDENIFVFSRFILYLTIW